MFSRKRGTSLIEVVIAMSVASAMLTAALGAIHLLLHAERGATKNIVYAVTLNRLSRTLRSDVHAAKKIEIVAADATHGQRLQLEPNDEAATVTYEISPGSISRIIQSADKIVERDQFRFPESTTMNVERQANPDRVSLVLVLPRNPTAFAAASKKDADISLRSRSVQIEAVASRDYRFAATGGKP